MREGLTRKLAKVGWTRGKSGRGTVDEESGCAESGGWKEKRLRWENV